MENIQQWRDSVSWFVATVTVALSYEIRNKGFIQLPKLDFPILDGLLPTMIAILLLSSSLYIARKSTNWAISKECVRAFILGENHVEGFWFLQTDAHPEETPGSPLSPAGVLWLRYEPSWSQYTVTTTRLDNDGKVYQIPSKIINMRAEGQILLYVNYFTVDNVGSHSTEGVSKGRFVKKGDFSRTKDRLDAYIFTESEEIRHQWAEKISLEDIKKNKLAAKESGRCNWMEEFLHGKKNA